MLTSTVRTPDRIGGLVGNTPLLRLRRFEVVPGVELYAKAEWQNPSGSVKARAAARIIEEGERSGALDRGRIILDATSGNTGIAYAMLAAAAGYRLRLCVPDNVTVERKRMLRAYGAEVIFTDPLEGSDGAITAARRLYAGDPDRYFYADQYNNDANWQAHFDTTGPEIIAQTGGRVSCFVAGLGTSGTFVGTARRLRHHDPGIRLVSVQPDSPLHGIEGLKHMDTAIVPGIYDPSLADDALRVETERAEELTRRLASQEGLLVGVSSGAALAAALDVAAEMQDGVIVMIFPDGGERYLTEPFWETGETRNRRNDGTAEFTQRRNRGIHGTAEPTGTAELTEPRNSRYRGTHRNRGTHGTTEPAEPAPSRR
jgi:cysteine synthase B